jgi:uncharacterized membrane protein YccF (DUF307 family)
MSLLLNLLWFVFGGFVAGLTWVLAGIILMITIVGLPWSAAAFRIAGFAFFPFGRRIDERDVITGREDLGTGGFGLFLNIIWIIFGGWYVALSHLVIAFGLAITLIGIPFALKHLQLAWLALAPVGKTVTKI